MMLAPKARIWIFPSPLAAQESELSKADCFDRIVLPVHDALGVKPLLCGQTFILTI
jgi:hypothetical protein